MAGQSGVRIIRSDRSKLQAIIQQNPRVLNLLVRAVAQEMNNEIVLSFGTSPSSPGDPPGVDTGALRASMGWEMEGQYKAFIFDGVIYGIYLEMGTTKMAARPFIVPVFERWQQGAFAQFVRDFGIIK